MPLASIKAVFQIITEVVIEIIKVNSTKQRRKTQWRWTTTVCLEKKTLVSW